MVLGADGGVGAPGLVLAAGAVGAVVAAQVAAHAEAGAVGGGVRGALELAGQARVGGAGGLVGAVAAIVFAVACGEKISVF